MLFSVPILATVLTIFVSLSQAVDSNYVPPRDLSVESTEDDQFFDHYETITHLMSSLHGRIGINDDAMSDYHLGRQEPHDIDPKDLKLVSENKIGDYDEAEWIKINGEAITLHCGSVNAATTGEDWALMQRCPDEEVAIRRLMATFNEEGHQFVVSKDVLHGASAIREGTHRCIKIHCPTGPLALSTPTAAVIAPEGAVIATQVGSHFSQPTTSQDVTDWVRPTVQKINSNLQFPKPTASHVVTDLVRPTTFSTVITGRTSEDPLPKYQGENEGTLELPAEEAEELPAGRWLTKRASWDPYEAIPRPQCLDPPDDFTLSGKVRTVYRNPRKTSYTTITWRGFTTTSTIPHDPNRPPAKASVVTPDWVTASFFQTFSCRKVWMEYFNLDRYQKRDIVGRVLEDLQAAARK